MRTKKSEIEKAIEKIKPPQELCKHCREWADADKDDIPHCIHESDYDCYAYMIGIRNKCPEFNEW